MANSGVRPSTGNRPGNYHIFKSITRLQAQASVCFRKAAGSRGPGGPCFFLRRPRPGEHPAIDFDVAVDDDAQGELFIDSPAGGCTEAPGFGGVVEELDEGL